MQFVEEPERYLEVLDDFLTRVEAAACFRAALECRCTEPERRFLRRRLAECEEDSE